MANQVGGIRSLRIDGVVWPAKGNWTVNMGTPERAAVIGADGPHGYKETHRVARFEGTITLQGGRSVSEITGLTESDVVLEMTDARTFILREAWYAGSGDVTTEEGELAAAFEGIIADEL